MNEKNMPKEFWQRADSLQKRTGYQFSDPELLRLAFTQRSGAGGPNPSMNNERLEFLGDAALGLLVGEALYQEYPEADEGFMTVERSKLVCGRNLSAWGYEAGFDRMLRVCEGVEVSDAMVEDSVEAVAGAFFLDGGLDAVRALLQSFSDYPDQGAGFDSRRHLERDCSYEKLGAPRYDTMCRRANGKIIFESTVSLDKEPSGTGLGADRTEAERNAARDAMCRLGREFGEKGQGGCGKWYVKADLLHEFCGDREVNLYGAHGQMLHKYEDGGDTWFAAGIGADVTMGKNSFFYCDVEKSFGADIETNWQVNLGVRWEF